jgi:hypothetical protein
VPCGDLKANAPLVKLLHTDPVSTVADATQMRAQLNGLKDLIDAVSGVTSAQVDTVSTLPPGSPAAVMVSVNGNVLHLSFDLPQGNDGGQGQNGTDGGQGPPFTNFVVDGVVTLNPGDNATVGAAFDGSAVRLNFGIPRGNDGATGGQGQNGNDGGPGPQGPPGEVSNAELQAAITGSSANSNAVAALTFGAGPSYDPAQQQEVIAKVNELISALRR